MRSSATTLDGIITSWNNGALPAVWLHRRGGDRPPRQLPAAARAQGRSSTACSRRCATGRAGRAARDDAACARTARLVDVSVTFSPIFDARTRSSASRRSRATSRSWSRARDEVAEREERIRLLLDSTAEAIYGIDLSGVCTFCNPACARLLGYDSPAALIGKQMHPLIHHTTADGTPYPPEQSPIYEAMRHRERGARRRRGAVARRRHVVSRRVLEPSDLPRRRGDRRGGHLPRHHRAAAGRGGDPGRRRGGASSSWRCCRTSCAIRWPRSSARRGCSKAAAGADDVCQEAGLVVERQAKHMARLLDDLLDVARITRGRIVLRNERLDLRDTARSAIEALGAVPGRARHAARRRHRRRADAGRSATRRGCSRSRRTC